MSLGIGGVFHIGHHQSETYLTVESGSEDLLAEICLSPLIQSGDNANSQVWYAFSLDTNRWLLVNKKSGLLLSPLDYKLSEGSTIVQTCLLKRDCHPQTWMISDVDDGKDGKTLQTVMYVDNGQYLYFNSSQSQISPKFAIMWPQHSLQNQMQFWSFQQLDPMTFEIQLPTAMTEFHHEINDIGDIVKMTSWEKPTQIRSKEVLIGKVVIPFPLVTDETVGRMWQAEKSPYYFLCRYGFWEMVFCYEESIQHYPGPGIHKALVGVTSHNADDVLRIIGIGVEAGPTYAVNNVMSMIRMRLAEGFQQRFEVDSRNITTSAVPLTRVHDGKRAIKAVWFRHDHYTLTRMDGTMILEWIVSDNTKIRYDMFSD